MKFGNAPQSGLDGIRREPAAHIIDPCRDDTRSDRGRAVVPVIGAPALEQSDDHAEVLEGLGSEGRFRPFPIFSDKLFAFVRRYAWERLKEIMEKDAGRDGQAAVHRVDGHSDPELGEDTGRQERKPSVNERLKDVLNKPREKLEIEDEGDQEKDQEVEKDREIDRGPTHGM